LLKNQVAELQKASEGSPKRKPPERIVIISHHAPSTEKTADPIHDNSPLTFAFATDLFNGEDWPNVKLWVVGHTHSTEFKKDGIKVLSNQRGYVFPNGDSVQKKDEKRKQKGVFDVRKVVHV